MLVLSATGAPVALVNLCLGIECDSDRFKL
jgi:hypothetical protein